MKISCISFYFITLAGLASLSSTPAPGEYLAENGRGTLQITSSKKGYAFKINSYGANGHSCFVEGLANGNTSVQKAAGSNEKCTITLNSKKDAIDVETDQKPGCLNFCGTRAQFTQAYFKTDAVCTESNKLKNLKLFKDYYTNKSFEMAEKTLRTVYDRCQKYMWMLEKLEIVNDLAITYKNLNKKDACLNLITPYNAQADLTEGSLKSGYPPAELESLLPVAKKLKFNRDLCLNL